MFEGYPINDINMYATTACGKTEYSYGYYCTNDPNHPPKDG